VTGQVPLHRSSPVSAVLTGLATRQSKVPRVLGALTYLVGFIDIASGLTRGWRHRLHPLADAVPGAVGNAASALTVVLGILLLLLAHALRRRKRRAWRAVVFLLSFSVLLHVVKLEPLATLGSALVLAVVLVYRKQFYALGDPTTRWLAVRLFFTLTAISVGLGLFVIWLRRAEVVGGPPSWTDTAYQVLAGLVGTDGPLTFKPDRTGDVIGAILLGLGLMTSLTSIYLFLRPSEPHPSLTDDDEAGMRLLLSRHPDSLGYFNLRRDKSVVWSDTRKAAIAYRVVSGVMLASGDPLGDPEAWPGAIENFLAQSEAHAWAPAVLGCSEHAGIVWCRETGFSALELGDEAVVDARSFSLEGRAMRNVRQMVKRVGRAGYATEVMRSRDVPGSERQRAIRDAAAWRGTETERGFSMALDRLVDPRDPDAVFVVARQDGLTRAFLQFVPWGPRGMSLDVMRRDRTAEPGVNELMIVDALRAARGLGVDEVSLNFAAFRSALERGERLGAGPFLRAWRRVLLLASRWFQIESLYRFNAKFQPQWTPRFIVYPGTRDLPRIAIAALEAEAFLTWPKLHLLSGRH